MRYGRIPLPTPTVGLKVESESTSVHVAGFQTSQIPISQLAPSYITQRRALTGLAVPVAVQSVGLSPGKQFFSGGAPSPLYLNLYIGSEIAFITEIPLTVLTNDAEVHEHYGAVYTQFNQPLPVETGQTFGISFSGLFPAINAVEAGKVALFLFLNAEYTIARKLVPGQGSIGYKEGERSEDEL